jgi:hypothetical protein
MYLTVSIKSPSLSTWFDLNRAIRCNRNYGWLLGWRSYATDILRLLGFASYIPSEQAFAEGVARWQAREGLPVNGILTPGTLYLLLTTSCPRNLPPAATRNVFIGDLLSGLSGTPDPFLCVAGGTLHLHSDVVDGVTNTRLLAGETFKVSSPVCKATSLCPTVFQPPHATGDATHFVKLGASSDPFTIRIAELAGLFGVDLTTITGGSRLRKKAAVAVKSLPSASPLNALSFVALRSGTKREVHIHRSTGSETTPRTVQSIVGSDEWNNLAFRATPGTTYTLVKRRWHEASFHRQWGKKAAIDWVIGLCNFYQDREGLRLGIGDISHVVGEDMTDHGSHEKGNDIDAYVLDYPSGSTFPEAYFCEGGLSALSLSAMVAPATASGEYNPAGATALTGTHNTDVWGRYATVLAYCFATWSTLKTFTWHGVRSPTLQADAIARAEAAFDVWKSSWGPKPASKSVLTPPATELRSKLIGQGSSSYGPGKGWPPHRDHMHIRLNL